MMRAAGQASLEQDRERHALWSLTALELARRLDPLQSMPVIEQNIALLSKDHADVAGLLAGREQPTRSACAEPALALEEPAYGQD